jgi:hypothetical protein
LSLEPSGTSRPNILLCLLLINRSYLRVPGTASVRLEPHSHQYRELIDGIFGNQSSVRLSLYISYPDRESHLYSGIGLFFSAFMICLTAIQARYTAYSPKNSEEFSSASRSVKPGLIASGIVSAWTWAATLVSFSTYITFDR